MDKMREIAGDSAQIRRRHSEHGQLIRVMAESLINEVMDAQTDEACGAGNRRNGYRGRRLTTSADTINLRIPKLRAGSCIAHTSQGHTRAGVPRGLHGQ
uniref:transposase n=1 Tax=Olsenella uli TaxID=133926 RepID=UPI001650F872